jgi:hypothetical protein
MKKSLLILFLAPFSIAAQTNTSIQPVSSFLQKEYVPLGKIPVYGTMSDMDISIEYVIDLNTKATDKFINISYSNAGSPLVYISLDIQVSNADSVISAVNRMIEITKTTPVYNQELIFTCSNGFEVRAYWNGNSWFGSFDYANSVHNSIININTTRFTIFVALLKQAKAKL